MQSQRSGEYLNGRVVYPAIAVTTTVTWIAFMRFGVIFGYGAFWIAPVILFHSAVFTLIGIFILAVPAFNKRYAGNTYMISTFIAAAPLIHVSYVTLGMD